MLFGVHDEDGKIKFANKVYDPDGYHDRLRDHGYDRFATCPVSSLRSPDHTWVRHGAFCDRPFMWVSLNKKTIKCGENDAAIFTDIPVGVQVTLAVGDLFIKSLGWTKTRLDFSMSTPGLYRLTFEKWPYQTFSAQIEVRA